MRERMPWPDWYFQTESTWRSTLSGGRAPVMRPTGHAGDE